MEKLIHGIPKKKWIRAFAEAAAIAIDKDYFRDILFFDLYPNAPKETEEDYEKLWDAAYAAFKEVFGDDIEEHC